MATADLSAGDSETITADLEPGDYTIFCSLGGPREPGHERDPDRDRPLRNATDEVSDKPRITTG